MTEPTDPSLPLIDTGIPTAPRLSLVQKRPAMEAVVVGLLAFALGLGIGELWKPSGTGTRSAAAPRVADAGAPGPAAIDVVGALGRLMPEGDLIALAPPFAAGDARVARILVHEGQRVAAGQLVAELDNLPQRLASHAMALAELQTRQAALAQARSVARLAHAEALASRLRATATRRAADLELARQNELAAAGMTTRAVLEQVQSQAAQAAAEEGRAEAAVERFPQRDIDRQTDVQLAVRNVESAKAALARAEQELSAARVASPSDGTVIALHVRVGERPGDRGIASLGNTDRMAAELEVYQTDVRRLTVGQEVSLTAAALDKPLRGKVSRIGLEVMRQAVLAADPVAHTDARVVKVQVTLDDESTARSHALTGLQVIGRVRVGTP